MKLELSNNGDYAVHVELTEVAGHDKMYALRFLTSLNSAKDPEEQQQKFIMFLTQEELTKFKNFL